MTAPDREFENFECAVNATHIQAINRLLSIVISVFIVYLISAITLFCIIAFDLATDTLLEQYLLVTSLFGLTPLLVALCIWRGVEKIMEIYILKYTKKQLKIKSQKKI